MSYQPYIFKGIQNGALTALKAMPQKDSTSDGTSTFEMDRAVYVKTLPHITQTIPQQLHKKWLGNRDASQVTTNRRTNQVGVGSLNAPSNGINKLHPTLSFTTYKEINTTNDALRRVRAGGAVAPAKKNANRNNNLTPSFAPATTLKLSALNYSPISTKMLYGNKNPTLYH